MFTMQVGMLRMAAVAAIIAAIGLSLPATAKDTKIVNPVPVVGKTADGKYDIYDLRGDLNDLNYVSSMHIIYQPDDLPARIKFLDPADVKAGTYVCDFICKDKVGHVVGLNPNLKKLYKVK